MVKFKKLKTVLMSVFTAGTVLSLGAFAAINGGTTKAYAAGTNLRSVTLDGNIVFYRTIRGAEITASEPEVQGEGDDAATVSYVKFNIGHDNGEAQTITYRQNLAYTWLSADKEEGSEGDDESDDGLNGYTNSYSRKYLSMSLSFESVTFKRFYIKLQSQQYVLTKDGVTDNYIIFTPAEGGKLQISVAQSLDEEEGKIKDEKVCETTYNAGDIFNLSLGHNLNDYGADYQTTDFKGDYDLYINGADSGLDIKNVYEHYASYVSSGDTAVTPLTFSAQFENGAASDAVAEMVIREINGQSFEVSNYTDVLGSAGAAPTIKDNAPPVMCFAETPSYLKYGSSISFNYKVIDVLASSPRSTAYYYVLTGEQYASETFDYDKTYSQYENDKDKDNDEDDGENEGEDKEELGNPFIQASSSSNYRIIRDDKTFNPQLDNVYGLVKIYYEIADVSGSSKQDDVVFVDWYAKKDALVNIYELKGGAGTSNFIKLIDDKPGVTYAQENVFAASTKDEVEEIYRKNVEMFQKGYQKAIDEAIEELEDGKLYAGGEKFYLPAIERGIEILNSAGIPEFTGVWSFMDDYFTSRDYKYSIYYKANSTGSNTSLAANKLSMDLNSADVTYTFIIYITDPFGNDMRYPTMDADGKIIWEKISTANVWDEEYEGLLPRFTVDVSYKKATAENPESLSLAYVKTNYSGVSFKITGVSGTYTANYNLYVFDRNAFNEDTKSLNNGAGLNFTFSDFVKNYEKLFSDTFEGVEHTRKYFTTVKPSSQLLETDANYALFKAINWNANTLSFTPQTVDDYYIVTLTLKDNRTPDASEKYFAAVAASVQTKSLKGESDWLEQNVTSVVLLAIAGVCLIALLVLLIVKPKDKGDIDVVYAEVEGSKSKNGKKNKKDKKNKN